MSAQQQPRRPQALLLQCARRALLCAEYAQVTRMLGNGRLEAFCFDGVNRLCHIRGKLRKRVWIGVVRWLLSPCTCAPLRRRPMRPADRRRRPRLLQGDIILLGLREFQVQRTV